MKMFLWISLFYLFTYLFHFILLIVIFIQTKWGVGWVGEGGVELKVGGEVTVFQITNFLSGYWYYHFCLLETNRSTLILGLCLIKPWTIKLGKRHVHVCLYSTVCYIQCNVQYLRYTTILYGLHAVRGHACLSHS